MSYYIDSLPFIPYPKGTNPMDMTREQKQYQNSFTLGEPIDTSNFNMMDMNRAQKQAIWDYNSNPTAPIKQDGFDSELNREEKSGLMNFNNGLLSLNRRQPDEPQGIFGDWGQGNQWDGLLSMPKNNFSYESQGFDYTPQPFNYTPQTFSYTPQPFTYDPKKYGGV